MLLPCGGELRWAVPQSCLAEILTLAAEEASPPAVVAWRGIDVPVVDLGADSGTPWCNPRNGTGLIVVIPGVSGAGSDYWGLALRGDGLAVRDLQEADCEELPEAAVDHSLAAFALAGEVYQVPDLATLEQLTRSVDAAASA